MWQINTMTATWEFNLRKYKLVPSDWVIAGELWDVLQVFLFHSLDIHMCFLLCQIFKDTTLFFSQGTPKLAMVICYVLFSWTSTSHRYVRLLLSFFPFPFTEAVNCLRCEFRVRYESPCFLYDTILWVWLCTISISEPLLVLVSVLGELQSLST